MEIKQNFDLTSYNTFGISACAKYFASLENENDIRELWQTEEFKSNQKLFLGGGSNTLFTADFDGLVILNSLKGIEVINENEEFVWVKSYTGEVWHSLVLYAVERNLWGIENLAYIPGSVGGAPMQNIGAYGVEIKETLVDLEAYDVLTGEKKVFTNTECKFGYRDSVFKQELKAKYFISAITLKLSKTEKKNTTYKILAEYLKTNHIEVESPKDISDAVTAIRKSKLPDPKVIGNAGSFFKNVFISREKKEELFLLYPDIPFFEEDGRIKIPSGWLIEECGWKGRRVGNVGVHDKQALVLVNYGGATGLELKDLSQKIIADIFQKFKIELMPEVNMI